MAEWDAEVVVSASEVGEIVAARYAEFRNTRVSEYAAGWDNTAFLVDDTFLFRFPRRTIAVDLLNREIALLPQIFERLPLPISAPQYHGFWRGDMQWPFAGYRMLDGQPASLRDLSDEERRHLTVPLASFLRELHGLDTVSLVETGLTPDLFGRFDAAKLLPRMLARVANARRAGYEISAALSTFAVAHPPVLDDCLTLVHGDLYSRHILIDADAIPCGIIDWGDMHLGTPAIDLAVAHTMLPPDAHELFLGIYGPVSETVWSAARWRGIYSALICLEYGIEADAEDMRRCGLAAIELIARAL